MRNTTLIAGLVVTALLGAAAAEAERAERGRLEVPMELGAGYGSDLLVMEPSMCEGQARAVVTWNRPANRVTVQAHFEGLPYRPDLCFEFDPQEDYPFNQFQNCTSGGKWQLWFMGRIFNKTTTFYYDEASGELLGHENDLTGPPEPGWVAVQVPATQMVCTDFFEPNPESLRANVVFHFDYDRILDPLGTAGVYVAALRRNLYDPDSIIGYYTNGGLPASEAMHFDDILTAIENGAILGVVSTYEPFPKPDYLRARDNPMVGWGGIAPGPPLSPPAECRTFQLRGAFGF